MTDHTFAIRGQLMLGSHLETGSLIVANGHIEQVVRGHERDGNLPATILDADIVSPGLVDLQVNGANGAEVGDDAKAIEGISLWLAQTGVTAWLPTIVTADAGLYPGVFEAYA
ncbi:MAG: hypothetical protein H0T93_10415, partial [Chloroflexia bacterium]|nr:hypothetical protein [Chloroflexia bacterium]